MTTRRLCPHQQKVLARLVAGETITRANADLVVTVYALRNRRLVETIKGGGAGWTAELTEAGRLAAGTGRVPTTLPKPRAGPVEPHPPCLWSQRRSPDK
jgi:hypothetical protein